MFSKTIKNQHTLNISQRSFKTSQNTSYKMLIGAGVMTAAATALYFKNNKTEKQEPENAFTQLRNLNQAINEKQINSFSILPVNIPKNVFRGSVTEYIEKHNELTTITSLCITGEQVRPGIFDSSIKLDTEKFKQFMQMIESGKIKELDLTCVDLQPKIGEILGQYLRTNSHLEKLSVTSSQLGLNGICPLLIGLANNTSLKELTMRSYNVAVYYWSAKEIATLEALISANQTLEKIHLPDNQIEDPANLRILMSAYSSDSKNVAAISGFEIFRSEIPEINKENVKNEILESYAQIKRYSPY